MKDQTPHILARTMNAQVPPFLSGIMWVILGLLIVVALSAMCLVIFPLVLAAPFVLVFTGACLRHIRRRRAAVLLSYLEQATRLNQPLPAALAAAARSERGILRKRLTDVGVQLENGEPLADTLTLSAPEITERIIESIRAAEHVGRLPQCLTRLLERDRRRFEVESPERIFDWTYFVMVLTAMMIAVTGIMVLIVPRFERIFDDFGVALPQMTQIVLQSARWMGGRGYPDQVIPGFVWFSPIFLGLPLGLIGRGARNIFHPSLNEDRQVQALLDFTQWNIPLLRRFAVAEGLAGVCHFLADSLRVGVTLPAAIQNATSLAPNRYLRKRLARWHRGAAEGQTISEAARAADLPGVMVGMLAAGQTSANVPDVLDFLGRYYATRSSGAVAVIYGVVTPLMVVALALLVGFVVVAMFLPLVALLHQATLQTGLM